MDNIIFDTNIFYKENFLEGKRINEFLKLSEEGHINIVLTEITIDEVKNNYKKLTKTALEYFSQFKNKFESRTLRNNPIGAQLFIKPKFNDLTNEFNDKFDIAIEKANVEIIGYVEVNIKDVFNKYFTGEYPFKKSDKKTEFPDAFALSLIQKWSEENDKKCIIFSKDNDFLKFETHNDLLTISDDYEVYLDKKLKEIILKKRLDILEKLFISNSSFIDKSISDWCIESLYDESLYYSFIYYEIHSIGKPEVSINEKKYQIISEDEEAIDIEIDIEVSFRIELVIDDEDSRYYDDEDKTTHFFETTTEVIERTIDVKVIACALIIDENDYEDIFEIIEINNNKKIIVEDVNYEEHYM